jgi:hypothetical protein
LEVCLSSAAATKSNGFADRGCCITSYSSV